MENKYSRITDYIRYGLLFFAFTNAALLICRYLTKNSILFSITHILSVLVWLIFLTAYVLLNRRTRKIFTKL